MRPSLLAYLACPDCGADLAVRAETSEGDEVVSGSLTCHGCDATFPIVRGVPRMARAMEPLENVARTFGYEWRAHHQGKFEQETLFGRTEEEDWRFFLDCMGASPEAIRGAVVLDAGCGSGRFARIVGEHGANDVVGVDINEAVDEAHADTRALPNVHVVQANIFALPFKERTFDFVWCSGVLHHTPDAAGAHRALALTVKEGGTLYVWVYAKRFNPFRFVKSVLDRARVTRLPEPTLYRLSRAISYPSVALLNVYRAARRLPVLRPRTAWGERTVRKRTLDEVHLTWFDALSPEYDSRHTEDEVIGWFRTAGFTNIEAIEEPKVGVRGRAAPVATRMAAPVGSATG